MVLADVVSNGQFQFRHAPEHTGPRPAGAPSAPKRTAHQFSYEALVGV
jgi:hypothetical protein